MDYYKRAESDYYSLVDRVNDCVGNGYSFVQLINEFNGYNIEFEENGCSGCFDVNYGNIVATIGLSDSTKIYVSPVIEVYDKNGVPIDVGYTISK